jgi:hypothetical protein
MATPLPSTAQRGLPPKHDSALEFDGVDDGLDVADAASLDMIGPLTFLVRSSDRTKSTNLIEKSSSKISLLMKSLNSEKRCSAINCQHLTVHRKARDVLSELIGKRMWAHRRAADMATFQFGPRHQTRDYHGRPTEIGEYALHIQCPWRIVRGNEVVVGSRDIYYPAGHDGTTSVSENFNWERDLNRRDNLLDALFDAGSREFTVRDVDEHAGGACTIEFDEGISLELFPDDSLSHEHWRLFTTQETDLRTVIDGKDSR